MIKPDVFRICMLAGMMLFTMIAGAQDSSQKITILGAQSLRQFTTAGGQTFQTLAGNARVRQGNTILSGDSIALNQQTGVAEVFGNVHINDSDTVHTYSQYLRYVGNDRIAYLKRNVRLTDGRGQLFTEDLTYDLATGIATYSGGGRVINGPTVLTSTNATYYSDTKDVFFKKNVHLTDPKYNITADSLKYNTHFRTATFIAPTHIVSKDGIIDTRSGTYNLDTGEAFFYDQTSFRDSTRSATGRNVAIDEKSGLVNIEGNGKLVDSLNQVIVLGNQIFLDRKKNSFLATRKPVMILYQDNDSTYITADTLFSGVRIYDSIAKRDSVVPDTLAGVSKKAGSDSIRYFLAFHNVKVFNDSLQAVSDSLYYSTEDSTFRLFYDPVFWNDSSQVSGDTMYLETINRKPSKLEVFGNSFVINKPDEPLFHQMAGNDLLADFNDGNIEKITIFGPPAESIFYPQDEDSAYIGMNRSKSEIIEIFFREKKLNRVRFLTKVEGTLYPMDQIPSESKYIRGFHWQDARRPKHALELFE